jgi:hypothetical protein
MVVGVASRNHEEWERNVWLQLRWDGASSSTSLASSRGLVVGDGQRLGVRGEI